MDCTTSWLSGIDAPFIAQLVALVTAVGVIVQTMRNGQTKAAAAAAITADQKNRELETRGAVPVTNMAPPAGTGNGSVDKAITEQLQVAPTTPAVIPPELLELLRDLRTALVPPPPPPPPPQP